MADVVVVIPCYREEHDRTMRTVESALATPNVTRVLVVNDGGDVGDLPCDVLYLPVNLGCAAALNAGIRAQEETAIVCRLDVGDTFYPAQKARQIDVVLSGSARCSSSPHYDPVADRIWSPPPTWERDIYRDSVFTGCTNVYRRDVWREVGGHDESLRYLADWDFSMKVQHAIGWHMHDEPTCEAGMYPGGHSARAASNPLTKKRRIDDHARVAERGRVLSHPDAYAHLRNPKWLRKRGQGGLL